MLTEERVKEVERSMGRWRILALLFAGGFAVSCYVWSSKLAEIDMCELDRRVTRDRSSLRIRGEDLSDGTTIDATGLSISGSTQDGQASRSLVALYRFGARLGVSTAGSSINLVTRVGSQASVVFQGKVTSELVVDTDTGEWTLKRYTADAEGNPTSDASTTQLLPPLPPQLP